MHRSLRLLLLPALILACGQEPSGEPTPLIDGVHAPLVLTEQAQLDKPPAYSGNRFLAGWWPGRRSHDPPQPLARDAEVPLPGGLPLGRLPIELDLRGARVRIEAAGFGHAWPPGEVQLSATAILQGGYSAVDFPRRQVGPATLVGTFEPPAEPEPDQRFAVILETDRSEPDTAFEWRGDKGAGRARRLRLDLPDGFLRIRLLAQGLGPAGRWLGMGIVGGQSGDTGISLRTVEAREGTAWVAASERFELVRAPGLGLPSDVESSRDAEYVFDLRRYPERAQIGRASCRERV